jgi:hypothetical protein
LGQDFGVHPVIVHELPIDELQSSKHFAPPAQLIEQFPTAVHAREQFAPPAQLSAAVAATLALALQVLPPAHEKSHAVEFWQTKLASWQVPGLD